MSDVVQADLIRELSLEIVGLLRPEELLLVDSLVNAPAVKAGKGLRAMKWQDEALGIGVSEVVALVTPAVVVAVTAAVNQAAGDVGRLTVRRGEKGMSRFSGRLFRRGRGGRHG